MNNNMKTPVLDEYCRSMFIVRQFPDTITGNQEDAVQEVMMRAIVKNTTRQFTNIPYIRKCFKNWRVSDIRNRVRCDVLHTKYEIGRLHAARLASSESHITFSLDEKKMALAVDAIPYEKERQHLIEKFYRETPRKMICEETGIRDIRQHDKFIKNGLFHLQQIWKAFDFFSEDEIRSMRKLIFLTTQEAAVKVGKSPTTVARAAREGRVPAIRIGKAYKIEPHWLKNYEKWA